MIEITKDTIIGDILDVAPQTAPIFLSIGMHCLGCPSSRGETVEEACAVHGIDVDKLLALVNEEYRHGPRVSAGVAAAKRAYPKRHCRGHRRRASGARAADCGGIWRGGYQLPPV